MVKRKFVEKTLQEQYYDGEAEYIDERYVSSYMFEGLNDCMEYLNSYDDVEFWNEKDSYTYDNYYSKLKKQEFENQKA